VNLTVGERYEEMGYSAVDCLGTDITIFVEVQGSVNTSRAGVYVLTYRVTDGGGNSARATRTIFVEDVPVVQLTPPTIELIGSNPILLHLHSGTPYIEQGARAIDSDGRNISNQVEITGHIDRDTDGVYTLTYSVVGRNGLEATTTRNVHIVAPDTEVLVSDLYRFGRKDKQGTTTRHSGIVAPASGWMDVNVRLDKNMTVSIQLVNTATGAVAVRDTFAASGRKQFMVGDGRYDLLVNIDRANGNAEYIVELLTPEVLTVEFNENEIPLGDFVFTEEQRSHLSIAIIAVVLIGLGGLSYILVMNARRKRKAAKR